MGSLSWLQGIFPPIATAFAPDGRVKQPPSGFFELLQASGIDGVVALGSNGEAAQLTEAERRQWIQLVKSSLPSSLRLIAGTGAESTVATIARTKAAAADGAQAALVIAPSYYRRHLTVEALAEHYRTVAEASPIPILIYNVPAHMGYDLGPDWIRQLVGHPNIAGIKDSSGDIGRLPGLREQLGPEVVILTGTGEKLIDALTAGADGAIAALANLAPATSVRIRSAWMQRRPDEARTQQRIIAPLGEAMTRQYGVPGLKAALRMLGYDHGDPRPPLPPLAQRELPAVRRLLEDAQLMPRALAS
ncbi:MAG TPA: dihydrodipicolinate synthase family protein [Candidatus Angelobacter sp.]|nr:dihydrodipicolinate synthase family protein [Candidatus Angelobacter sp.]